MAHSTFKGGIHPHKRKRFTREKPIREYYPKGELVYPVSQHIGGPAVPIVKVGERVLKGQVIAIENDFFGHTVDVAGLVTGGDLIAQLRGRDLGERLLIPVKMLRHGGDVFLDDVRVSGVERELGLPVTVVDQDGFDLLDAMLGRSNHSFS